MDDQELQRLYERASENLARRGEEMTLDAEEWKRRYKQGGEDLARLDEARRAELRQEGPWAYVFKEIGALLALLAVLFFPAYFFVYLPAVFILGVLFGVDLPVPFPSD
jgi:hypothetical protein